LSSIAETTLEQRHTSAELLEIAPEWNDLAAVRGSPFLTAEWFAAWWAAFGAGKLTCFVLRDEVGALRAAACFRPSRSGVAGVANNHSGDWDGLASDQEALTILWQEMASLGFDSVVLPLICNPTSVDAAAHTFRRAGYAVATTSTLNSPFLILPSSWDDLMAGVSRKLRKQFHRSRRLLEREGRLILRTTSGGPALDESLRSFFSVEASGWKGRSGSAINSRPQTRTLYTDFAKGLARRGWLRIHLLELDEQVIAGALACNLAGNCFLIKTGFDERFAALSPGLVLRGETLRASIDEGAHTLDFLGGPAPHKLRWGAEPRPRVTVRAYRGWRRSLALYHSRLRGPLRSVVLSAELRSRKAEQPMEHVVRGRFLDLRHRW
jgi:CelD/BcsL family acetyltransferase involved in cellulose biosynthesis